MIGWYTDNLLSYRVMQAVAASGVEIRHIREFDSTPVQHGIFYGILRGCGRAMHILQHADIDFHYIDNGYFDAHYVDENHVKDMGGTFRVVKNGMHEAYPVDDKMYHAPRPMNVLMLPPSPYSANFYDTTPEDWQSLHGRAYTRKVRVRGKNSVVSLDDDLRNCDGVVSFNSMAVIRAVELGIPVHDSYGVFRGHADFQYYDLERIKAFYEPKQFTLEQIASGAVQWI